MTVTDKGMAGADAGLLGTGQRTDEPATDLRRLAAVLLAKDTLPGQLSGQADTGFGAVWWLSRRAASR